MEWIHGETEFESHEGEVESHMHMRVGDDGEQNDGDTRSADATGFAGRVRQNARSGLVHARGALAERGGGLDLIRRNPLTSLGIAMAAGFAIGIATESPERHWAIERARRRIRTALISGVTAMVAQELRSVVGSEHGLSGLFDSFLSGDDDDLDDYDV